MMWRVRYWDKYIPNIAIYMEAPDEKTLLVKCVARGFKVISYMKADWLKR